MKCSRVVLTMALAFVALAASQAAAQNLLTDPGFEDPTKFTMDGAPFVGFWEAFNGGGPTSVQDGVMPRSGAGDAHLTVNNHNNNFAGFFQDVPVAAGQILTYSGWNKADALPFGPGLEYRIEWRNAAGNNEVGRTPNFVPVVTTEYTPFSTVQVVPAGADLARVVYAIQTFGGTSDTGQVFLDDFSVTVIPEPATMALAGLAGTAAFVALGRRRK
jgi:hypothetical protein